MRTLAISALLALLAGSLYYAWSLWTAFDSEGMPAGLYWAMAGGIFFSLLIGCGLMALVFYSSRHGYDDRVSHSDRRDDR